MAELIFYTPDGKEQFRVDAVRELDATPIINEPIPMFNEPRQTELRFSAHIRDQDILSLLAGKRITNNWLKMHGGVMRRKVHERRK